MKGVINGIVAAAVGGIVVVLFQHFLLNVDQQERNLNLTENRLRFDKEIMNEADQFAREAIKVAVREISGELRLSGKEISTREFEELLLSSFEANIYRVPNRLEGYGSVSEFLGQSTSSEVASTVLVEGRRSGTVYIHDPSGNVTRQEGDFRYTFKVPPGEKFKIFQIQRFDAGSPWIYGDRSILVSVDGKYVASVPINEIEPDFFFGYFEKMPLALVIMVGFGVLCFVYLVFEGFFRFIYAAQPDQLFRMLELYSPKQLAQIVAGIHQSKTEKPSKFADINAQLVKISPGLHVLEFQKPTVRRVEGETEGRSI